MPEASLLAEIKVTGAEESTRKVLAFSNTFDKVGDKVADGGKKASQGLNGVEEAVGGLSTGLGVLGLSAGVGTLISLGNDALQSANALEKTEATVRALSGSQERYNDVLAQARQGQALYGGSLNDNLKALGSFVNLSNRTGVELSNIDNIARRLATVDPAQGIEGAATALREALSGSGAESLISLRDRFEIPKEAIAAMGEAGITAKEKVEILDKALNDLGISNDVLSNSTNTSAAAYDRFGSAIDNAKTAIGGFLQDALLPYIESATGLLGIFQGTEDGVLSYANAMLGLTGAGRELTESEEAQVLAIGRFLGIVDEAIPATTDMASATNSAAAAADYYAGRLGAAATEATRGFRVELSASGDAARANAQELAGLTDVISHYEDAVSSVQDAINRNNLERQVAERSTRDEQAALESATDAVQNQERHIRDLERGLQDEKAAIDAANDAVATQERVVRGMEAALDDEKQAIDDATDAVKRQEQVIREHEAALADEKAAVKSAQDAIADKKDEIEDAERAYAGYEDSIARANKRLDRQKDYTDAAKESFDALKDSIGSVQDEIDRLKGTPLVGDAELQAQIDAIDDQRAKLELAIVQAKRGGADQGVIDDLEKQKEALDLQQQELELQNEIATAADRRAIDRFGDAQQEQSGNQIIAQLERQKSTLDGLNKQLGPAEENWQRQVEAQGRAERSVERAQRAYERYKDSLDPLRAELVDLNEQLDAANEALRLEDEKIDPLRLSLDGLKQNVDNAKQAYDEANGAIDGQRQILETLKGKVDLARDAYAEANKPIDAQRGILEELKRKQDDANLALGAAKDLLKPYYDEQQKLNDKLVDANLALADANELYGPQITYLENWTPAADAAAKAGNLLAAAYDAVATAQNRVNDAIQNAPPVSSVPDYIRGIVPYQPGGATGDAAGTIYNGIEADDPRPSQGGINSVVQGGTLGSTFDADRGALGVHAGLDLRVADGSPVHAPLDLFDIAVGSYNDTQRVGSFVQGTDRKGRRWYFGHLATPPPVKKGDFVPKGGVIGYVAAGMGHTHVQLQRVPAPAGQELIDPSAALEESALGANAIAGSYDKWNTDLPGANGTPATSGFGQPQDAARVAEDAAYLLDTAVDTLAGVAGYSRNKKLPEKLAQLKADFTLALTTVDEILAGLDADGVKKSADIADGTSRMAFSLGDSVDALVTIGDYEHDVDFNAAVDQLSADYKYFTDKLLDIAAQTKTDGLEGATELYEATDAMMGIAVASIDFFKKFEDYPGLSQNLLDWWGHDQRLFIDKLLDIRQYYDTEGVAGAADLFESQQRTFAPVDQFFDLIARFNAYRGVAPTVIDWVFGDQRKYLDKLIDLTYYYDTDGIDAAADLLEAQQRTFEPIHASIDLAKEINAYPGVNKSMLDWWGGDMRMMADKVIDVDYHIAGSGDAASRLNTNLLAIRDAMQTGMSMGDAVMGYSGGAGFATSVFGEIEDSVESVTNYWADLRSDGVAPALLGLKDQVYLGGLGAVEALGDALNSGTDGSYAAGFAHGEAFARGVAAGMGGINTDSTRGGNGRNLGVGDETKRLGY